MLEPRGLIDAWFVRTRNAEDSERCDARESVSLRDFEVASDGGRRTPLALMCSCLAISTVLKL
jgi:hypothetical protein